MILERGGKICGVSGLHSSKGVAVRGRSGLDAMREASLEFGKLRCVLLLERLERLLVFVLGGPLCSTVTRFQRLDSLLLLRLQKVEALGMFRGGGIDLLPKRIQGGFVFAFRNGGYRCELLLVRLRRI